VDSNALAESVDRGRSKSESEAALAKKISKLSESDHNNLAQRNETANTKIELPSSNVTETDSRANGTWGFRGEQFGRGFGDPNLNGPPPQVAQAPSIAYTPAGSASNKTKGAQVPDGFALSGGRDASAIDAVTGLPITVGKELNAEIETQKSALAREPEFVGVLENSEGGSKKRTSGEIPAKPDAQLPPGQTGRGIGRAGRIAGDEIYKTRIRKKLKKRWLLRIRARWVAGARCRCGITFRIPS